MRYTRVGTLLTSLAFGALIAAAPAAAQQRGAEVQLEQALHVEQVDGDLQQAITLYQRILGTYPANRVVGAKAQLHIGLCYETLGRIEAERAYQEVIRNYADQSDVVREARAHLAALRPAAAEGHGPVARRLLSGDDMDVDNFYTMAPSPDGRRVAYVDIYVGRLYVRDLASGREDTLAAGLPEAFNWSPTWSPDGRRIAFAATAFQPPATSIKVVDLASRAVVSVPGTEVPYSGRGVSPGLDPVDWSRDGRFLLFGQTFRGAGALGVVPVGGGARRMLTDSIPNLSGGSFSPDGRFVTYATGPEGSEQVFIQPVAGGARRQVSSGQWGNVAPLWSPDGNAIAWVGEGGVWMVRVVNGKPVGPARLAFAHSNLSGSPRPVWTREGGLYLTYQIADMIPYRLAVDPATGVPSGSLERLAPYPEWITSFAWSPDMRRSAFGTWSGDLIVYALDGSSRASYSVSPRRPLDVLTWTGDGREVVCRYRHGERPGTLLALDVATGAVREVTPWLRTLYPTSVSFDGGRMLDWYRPTSTDPSFAGLGLAVVETGRSDGQLVAPLWDADSLILGESGTYHLSPRADQVLFSRQARGHVARNGPDASSLWVVNSDSTGLRRIGTMRHIISAFWDPTGRFVAYAGLVDTTKELRIVEVATGQIRGTVPLPDPRWQRLEVTDWSRDGRYIAIAASEPRSEYWAVQGLLEDGH
jgi:WD40 repeat protein